MKRFIRLPSRAYVASVNVIVGSRQLQPVSKSIVQEAGLQGQGDGAACAVVAIDGDLIRDAGGCGKDNAAARAHAAFVVLDDGRQAGNRRARINSEGGIKESCRP